MQIAIINTGGTISCIGNPLAPMSAAAFAAACQQIIDPIVQQQYPDLVITYLTNVQFPESSTGTLDSTNLQPTDWCVMAAAILETYSQYDGWIILHGTDSMDFTGAALPFLLSSFSPDGIPTAVLSKPVIITGSQVPLFEQADSQSSLTLNYNTDAFQNLCGSVAAAQSGIPEVCIYFQNCLYRGNRAVKTNASEFNAFSSPNYPALAEYGVALTVDFDNVLPGPVCDVSLDNLPVLSSATAQLNYISQNINSWPVMQFNAFPAYYTMNPAGGVIANLIHACIAQGIKGLILESYGEGNFPSGNPDHPNLGAAYQALDAANSAGVVIVDCTQVLSGVVNDSAYAAGAWLPAVGALSPADMTPMAAVAKLMILLAAAGYEKNSWTPAQVKTLLQLNLLGEMRSVSRLDSRINGVLLASQSISTLDGSATLVNDPVLGPILTSQGSQVWAAMPSTPPASQMPGRLVMQNDGNLVFYSRYNAPLWATNTGVASGASSMLILGGSGTSGGLSLQVYDYSTNAVSAALYPQEDTRVTMNLPQTRQFKFSGRVSPTDTLHQTTSAAPGAETAEEHYIAPTTVQVMITTPASEAGPIGVPQYAAIVFGDSPNPPYDPAQNCAGYFTSYLYQPNNNCYAYGCNIAPNTFPQPGRASGCLIAPATLDGETISGYAVKDGLVFVGTTIQACLEYQSQNSENGQLNGHFVALMISPPGDVNWPGDYHWARCDNSTGACNSWSQKDGNDQITNFDFAGNPITDPSTANWTVNQGPINPSSAPATDPAPPDTPEVVVTYNFYCFLFVPFGAVNII